MRCRLPDEGRSLMTRHGRFRLAVLVLTVGLGGAAFAATGGHKAGPQEAVAFANVLADGTLNVGASSDQVADSNISHTANSGVYCFTDLPFLPSNAVVAGDNSFGNNDTLASISIDKRDPARGARRLSGRRQRSESGPST